MIRPPRDFADDHVHLTQRVTALETGAHPRRSIPGKVGRNMRGMLLTPSPGCEYAAGAAIYARIRADFVYFETIGAGVTFALGVSVFHVGPRFLPSRAQRLYGQTTFDGEVVLEARPSGAIVAIRGDVGGYLKLRVGWPVG